MRSQMMQKYKKLYIKTTFSQYNTINIYKTATQNGS